MLIGPAGTGKGVVIDAAAKAELEAGREPLGVALAGQTAQRLAPDPASPLAGRTQTIDSLLHQVHSGRQPVSERTTILVDEAAMLDTRRTAALFELAHSHGAKLVLVGDSRQLASIEAGGMFDRIHDTAPSAELETVRRARDPADRAAWKALRDGDPERALAHYYARGQLRITDTRPDALEQACQRYATLTQQHPPHQVALILDGPNSEIDRANHRVQHLRDQQHELGQGTVEHPNPEIHYPLRDGDRVAFTAQHHIEGQQRVENGSRGQILAADPDAGVIIALDVGRR